MKTNLLRFAMLIQCVGMGYCGINGSLKINIVNMSSTKALNQFVPNCGASCTGFYLVFNVTIVTKSQWLSHGTLNIPVTKSNTALSNVNYAWIIQNPSTAIFAKILVQLQARVTPTSSVTTAIVCGWRSLPMVYLPLDSFYSYTPCGDVRFQYTYEYRCSDPRYLGINCDCTATNTASQCYNCTSDGQKTCCPGYSQANCTYATTPVPSSSTGRTGESVSAMSPSASPCTCPSASPTPNTTPSPCSGQGYNYYRSSKNPFYIATWALTGGAALLLLILLILLCLVIERHRKVKELQGQINRAQTLLRTSPYTVPYGKSTASSREAASSVRDPYDLPVTKAAASSRSSRQRDHIEPPLYQRRGKLPPPLTDITVDSESDYDPGYDNPSMDTADHTPVYRPITRV